MSVPTTPVDYQRLFRSLPDNYLLLTPDATIVDNTDGHVAVSLKPREEVVGRPLFEAYPVVDKNEGDIIAQSLEYVRQRREPHPMPLIRYDLERPAEQGGGFEEMYWQATHFPILDQQGALQFILQRTQNVTEQHRATQEAARVRQELAESEDRMRFVLESLPVLIWTAQPDGRRNYFNSRWVSFTGRPLNVDAGENWSDSIHPEDQERVLKLWHDCLASGEVYQAEYRLRRHDGQYRWILMRAVPRRNDEGQITLWVGGGAEIHEQKLMVQELLQANEEQAALSDQAYQQAQLARQQRQIFHNLLMDAPAMVSIVRGPEHRYEFANNEFLTLVGEKEVVGRTVAEVFPEIVGQGIVAMLDGVFRTGEPVIGKELLVQIDSRDGHGTLRDAYFSFVYNRFEEHGQPAGITAYSYEVTELVQARQALEQLRNASGSAPAV